MVGVLACGPGTDPRTLAADEARQFLIDQKDKPLLVQMEMSVSAWMDDPLALDLLREGLDSTDTQTRDRAIDALGRRGDDASREILRGALSQVTGVARLKVAQALARMGDDTGRAMLEDQYLDAEGEKTPNSAARAISALATLDPDAARPHAEKRMKLGARDRSALYPVLKDIDADWSHALVKRSLAGDSGASLNEGILALGGFGRSGDAEALIEYSNKTATAQSAFQAMGHVGGAGVVQRLERGLKSKNPVERLHSAASLWRLGERETARPAIEEISTSADEAAKGFKTELAWALVDLDDSETNALVAGLIREMDPADKYNLLLQLRDRDQAEVVDLMRATVENHARGDRTAESYSVAYAIEALVRNAPDETLFEQLSALVRDDSVSAYVRLAAAAGVVTVEKTIVPTGA
jgi:HEAT repeat protein